MKKWIPFIFIIVLALGLSINLFLGGENNYIPATSEPDIIYKEACLECHGDAQQPANLWSPDLSHEILHASKVRQIIRHGNWRMPAFSLIPDSTLDSLVEYVIEINDGGNGKGN